MNQRTWMFSALLIVVGCRTPHDSINAIIERQSRALEQMPSEARARMFDPNRTAATQPAEELRGSGLLTLEEARDIALKSNPDIQAAQARLEAALARITEARSFYFPKVNLTHQSSRTFMIPNRQSTYRQPFPMGYYLPQLSSGLSLIDLLNTFSGPLSGALFGNYNISTGNTNSFSDHQSTLSASWVLFDGFVREARLLSVKQMYVASAMSLANVERLLIQAVDSAYHQAQLGVEQLRIAQADEQFSLKQLANARKNFEAGKISKADVLNFEVRVRAAQANVVAARGVQETGRVVLAELLALTDAQLPTAMALALLNEEGDSDLQAQDVIAWIDQAMAARADLAEVQHFLKATEENIVMARGQFYPELSLRGSWGFENAHNVSYSDDDQSSAIALEMRWAIFTGGYRTSQVRRANAEWWEANAGVRRKGLQICREVRQAVIDLTNAQEQVYLQRDNLRFAEENRRLVETQYDAGKSSLVRMNEAQRDYVQTEGELVLARIRLRQAWSDLHAAAGTYYRRAGDDSPDVAK
ncbi:MAG: TolC family protein [Phycisphaerales bacterium]|nr:TolC family protein [Phycisphaerales bacterium]